MAPWPGDPLDPRTYAPVDPPEGLTPEQRLAAVREILFPGDPDQLGPFDPRLPDGERDQGIAKLRELVS